MKTLRGKKALLTGAASGIGRALALALARAGTDLYLLDLDETGLADVTAQAQRAGVEAVSACCDLTNAAEITACLQRLLAHWGRLDILINNAGVACYGPTEHMTEEQWRRLLAVNLLAPIQIIRELLPTLLAREESHILNVGSLAGLVATGKMTAYNVSKFGLQGLSEALRVEYGQRGLGVTSLCPGFVDTKIYRAAHSCGNSQRVRTPPAWLMTTPERVAAKALRALRKNRPLVLVTPLAHVLWLFKRLAPSLFLRLLTRKRRQRPRPAAAFQDPAHESIGSGQCDANKPGAWGSNDKRALDERAPGEAATGEAAPGEAAPGERRACA